MVSSVRRCTEYMSALCGLKVSVLTSCQALKDIHLRNEFDFWKVHGNMNTSGLLQSK